MTQSKIEPSLSALLACAQPTVLLAYFIIAAPGQFPSQHNMSCSDVNSDFICLNLVISNFQITLHHLHKSVINKCHPVKVMLLFVICRLQQKSIQLW